MKPNFTWALAALLLFSACGDKTGNDVATTDSTATTPSEPAYTGMHPEWSKNATIYEVNIRQYTKEGTFSAFQAHLPRLKKMGVDILWLMPIHPIGKKNRKMTEADMGSYYSVADYQGVAPEYGTMDDFKALVKAAHNQGMKVILDWVANHSAWDNPWMDAHPDWYEKDSTGAMISPYDWSDVVSLDYNNPEMRQGMIDALKFWVEEADVDGYRCDVAFLVPTDFWNEARAQLDKVKPVFMLAEAEHHELKLQDEAFNMRYAWEFHHILNDVAKGEKPANDLFNCLNKCDTLFPGGAMQMCFTSNHDENSWNGTVKERLGDGIETFAVLCHTVPGMPLVYSGQEAGLNHRLAFFTKDEIDWSKLPLEGFYTKLNHLKHNNPALWNGEWGGSLKVLTPDTDKSGVVAYSREKDGDEVVVVLNLTGEEKALPEGTQQPAEGSWTDLFSDEELSSPDLSAAPVPAWGYRVLVRKQG